MFIIFSNVNDYQDRLTSITLVSREHTTDQYQFDRTTQGSKTEFVVCFSDARNMARDVHKCLVEVITTIGNKSSQEAEDYIKRLQQKGRYAQDVWS